MHAGGVVKGIVVVICVIRVERCGNAIQAGVGNWACGQSLTRIGVVRTVNLCLLIGQRTGDAAETINDRGVDVQEGIIAGSAQAVIDDGGNVRASFAPADSFSTMDATVISS